jgi:glycosyltransferase involved in cell wall biosynthesis
MDVLCAPGQTTPHWREQFGRMLIEAFACGVPVLTSDSGEFARCRRRRVVVGERTIVSGGRSVRSSTIDRRADLGLRGRRPAESVYAWPVVARQHLAFFDELVR